MRADDVAVVGGGLHAFGRHEGRTGLDMAEVAVRAALDDAGVRWADVDLAVGGSNVSGKPDSLVARLGLTGLPFTTVRNGCATGGVALATAVSALQSRRAELVVVLGFDAHERGAFAADPAAYGLGEWYASSGLMVTTQYFAMRTRRYQHEHGVSDLALARIASRAFRNGAAHPTAWRRTPWTEEEVLASAPVNDPLTTYMFCQPSQGAVALVLARGDRAADLCPRPVRLASVTQRTRRFGSFEVFSPGLAPDPWHSPSVDAAAAAFAEAGVAPADVQVAQVQDTDSGSELVHLAETGLCAHGAQEQLLADGATDVDGVLPVNTDGGCLANGEPVGASGLRQVHEVVRQLQGRAAGAQVPGGPRVGFTHVYGAPGISACAVLTADAP
ncbi:thiolase family protein [Modestobacter sp. I12A-02628]|uniref:Thiolase family protein n=1 Tax=Goekera deserti TaxID=2497753 RepID=A0A7K3WGC1_9ACTN|nr:thiolase family protein [Goekera deserti]MPQ96542.1 thiolase family protein [Goekera deserti]NDI47145.1 thiolase family protein [Goekera deserti]NEL55457.1 thiolase family protein [Goekera deserti]